MLPPRECLAPMPLGSKKPSTKVSRERDNSVDRYAVEQLEPKILFSAGPIDAPPEVYGLSPLDSVDSSALEEVHFAEVVEVEMGPEFFDSDGTEASVLGDGEDFNWGSETGPDDLLVGEGNEDLAAPQKVLVDLGDNLAETGDHDGLLGRNFGADQAAEMTLGNEVGSDLAIASETSSEVLGQARPATDEYPGLSLGETILWSDPAPGESPMGDPTVAQLVATLNAANAPPEGRVPFTYKESNLLYYGHAASISADGAFSVSASGEIDLSSFHPDFLAQQGFTNLIINGSPSTDDTLIVDLTAGDLPINVTYHGGDEGFDTLVVNGAQNGRYTPGKIFGDGVVESGSSLIVFTGLEPVIIDGTNDVDGAFTFEAPVTGSGGADVIVIDSPANGQNRISGTSGGVAFESITFSNFEHFILDTGSNDLDGADEDSIEFASPLVAAGLQQFSIRTGGGNDFVNLAKVDPAGPVDILIDGGSGLDELGGFSQDTVWDITATDGGALGSASFERMEVLLGSPESSDTFKVFADGRLSGSVNGGAGGTDVLDLSQQALLFSSVENPDGSVSVTDVTDDTRVFVTHELESFVGPDDTQIFEEIDPDPEAGELDQPNVLIFVETSLPKHELLLESLFGDDDNFGLSEDYAELVFIDPADDGVQLVTDVLAEAADRSISAIHVLSHGAVGVVGLGSVDLDLIGLATYAELITTWDRALTEDADILLYGCRIAAGDPGGQLVETLATLTGADVIASIDDTGSASLGANWNLEFTFGEIQTVSFVPDQSRPEYTGLLKTGTATLNGRVEGTDVTDKLMGEAGKETLVGKGGDDVLEGKGGDDTYEFSDNFGRDTINEVSGAETLDFTRVTSRLTIRASSLTTISVAAGTGNVNKVTYIGRPQNGVLTIKLKALTLNPALEHRIILSDLTEDLQVTVKRGNLLVVKVKTTGKEVLRVHNVSNVTLGKGDDRVIFEKRAILRGYLNGGLGQNWLDYGGLTPGGLNNSAYSAQVFVNTGDTNLTSNLENGKFSYKKHSSSTVGNGGADMLKNFEKLTGGQGDDHLVGSNLDGGDGDDLLRAVIGDISVEINLAGGKGNDWFLLYVSAKATITDTAGDDTIRFFRKSGWSISKIRNLSITDTKGNDTLDFSQLRENVTLRINEEKIIYKEFDFKDFERVIGSPKVNALFVENKWTKDYTFINSDNGTDRGKYYLNFPASRAPNGPFKFYIDIFQGDENHLTATNKAVIKSSSNEDTLTIHNLYNITQGDASHVYKLRDSFAFLPGVLNARLGNARFDYNTGFSNSFVNPSIHEQTFSPFYTVDTRSETVSAKSEIWKLTLPANIVKGSTFTLTLALETTRPIEWDPSYQVSAAFQAGTKTIILDNFNDYFVGAEIHAPTIIAQGTVISSVKNLLGGKKELTLSKETLGGLAKGNLIEVKTDGIVIQRALNSLSKIQRPITASVGQRTEDNGKTYFEVSYEMGGLQQLPPALFADGSGLRTNVTAADAIKITHEGDKTKTEIWVVDATEGQFQLEFDNRLLGVHITEKMDFNIPGTSSLPLKDTLERRLKKFPDQAFRSVIHLVEDAVRGVTKIKIRDSELLFEGAVLVGDNFAANTTIQNIGDVVVNGVNVKELTVRAKLPIP
ncbi:DUF4347 domain-containing protein [Akkermansiaceae bacterium]|nr:DUF4347 domain-containing protein [Akkermansiaceae bacterium]